MNPLFTPTPKVPTVSQRQTMYRLAQDDSSEQSAQIGASVDAAPTEEADDVATSLLKRVLIVDNNIDAAELMADLLTAYRCEICFQQGTTLAAPGSHPSQIRTPDGLAHAQPAIRPGLTLRPLARGVTVQAPH